MQHGKKIINFTEGRIVGPLLRFALPVMFALFLQSMYGVVCSTLFRRAACAGGSI